MESVLTTNYLRPLRGIQVLPGAIELVKRNAFWKVMTQMTLKIVSRLLKKFVDSLDKKDRQSC